MTEEEIIAAANAIAISYSGRSLAMTSPRDRIDITKTAKAALEAAEAVKVPGQRGRCKDCGVHFDPPTSQCPTCATPLDFPYLSGSR